MAIINEWSQSNIYLRYNQAALFFGIQTISNIMKSHVRRATVQKTSLILSTIAAQSTQESDKISKFRTSYDIQGRQKVITIFTT